MTIMEPGNVCVWQRGPLDDLSFKLCIVVGHAYDTFGKQMEKNEISLVKYYYCTLDIGDCSLA